MIEGIDTRPHIVLYDDSTNKFYVIGSTSGTVYTFVNDNGHLVLKDKYLLADLVDSYVRSISIIDGSLYTVSGPNAIIKYEILDNGFKKVENYEVPDEFFGMNQIKRIGNQFYITVNTDKAGDVSKSTIIRTDDLNKIIEGKYEVLKDELGCVGQPYFISMFDDRIWVPEISETKGNGIRSFSLDENDNLQDIQTLFYWEDVKTASIDRYRSKYVQDVDLFLFSGQSNMSGKGDASLAPSVMLGYEFRSITDPTQLYLITKPFGINENKENGINDVVIERGTPRKLGGLVSSFANSYYQTTGIPIVGVSASEGATRISEWLPGSELYNDAVDRIYKAKKYLNDTGFYRIGHTCLVWCQGESDGDAGMLSNEYFNDLENIINTMVRNKDIDKALIIRIGEYRNIDNLYDEIIDAQTKISLNNRNAVLISTRFSQFKKTGEMIDECHYTQNAYNLVGEEAGTNAGAYTTTGTKPIIYDYKKEIYIEP